MEIRMLSGKTVFLKGKKEGVLIDPEDNNLLTKDASRIVLYTSDGLGGNNFLGNKVLIRGTGEYEIGGVEINGYNAENEETVYVVQIDGVKIVVLGQLSQALSNKRVEKIDSADVLITPVVLGKEMSYKTVKDWAKKWGVNYMLPIDGDADMLKKFLDAADEEGLEAIEVLKIEKDNLPDGLELKLLKKV